MVDTDLQAARDLVALEGSLLDQRDWDRWLDLFVPEAEYWIPCWLDEYSLTDDPTSQLSLIYYSSRAGLEDRVFRIRTGKSLASTPLPRTSHIISIVSSLVAADGSIRVESNWCTFSYKLEAATNFFGSQIHVLKQTTLGLRILKRKIIVMNDTIQNVLDIYSV
jgi:benzoate/toluate 1,2-dioxygenase beta subunit